MRAGSERIFGTPRTPARCCATLAVVALLTACGGALQMPEPEPRGIEAALRGKTLTNESGARIRLGRDGTISGSGVAGHWWVQGSRVCRTLVAPVALAGTTCQSVTISEDRVAFESPGGRTLSFRMEN